LLCITNFPALCWLFSGKSFENVRLRRDIVLAVEAKKVKRLVAHPTFKSFDIISDDLSLIEMARSKVTLNKPIYTGFCVLELSKWLMYDFHYRHMVAKYEQNVRLCSTDTDSLCYHVTTPDIYADMKSCISRFDTSNYPDDEQNKSFRRATRRSSGNSRTSAAARHLDSSSACGRDV